MQTRLPRTTAIAIAAAAVTAALSATAAFAQDPAIVNARTITVKVENERVRVLEATIAPGVKEQPHSHPASVIYVIEGGTMRNHAADGTTSDATYSAGQTVFREPLVHWAENIGTTTVRLVIVELKK